MVERALEPLLELDEDPLPFPPLRVGVLARRQLDLLAASHRRGRDFLRDFLRRSSGSADFAIASTAASSGFDAL